MTQSNGDIVVAFENVSFIPPNASAPVLEDFSLDVFKGEIVVLLGESGSGKTTSLKLINRLIDPTSGRLDVEGKSIVDWDPVRLRRRIGYVIQEAGLFPHFTIARNVGLVPTLEGWDADRIAARVDEMLQLVKLDPARFANRFPSELSGGQRQRVGVARALAADPPLLLLDEPFGALDPLTRASLQQEFGSLVQRLNKTAVFVTHDVREALILGTRIALMDRGRLALVASPEEFLASKQPLAMAYVNTLATRRGPISTLPESPTVEKIV